MQNLPVLFVQAIDGYPALDIEDSKSALRQDFNNAFDLNRYHNPKSTENRKENQKDDPSVCQVALEAGLNLTQEEVRLFKLIAAKMTDRWTNISHHRFPEINWQLVRKVSEKPLQEVCQCWH